MNLRWWWEWLRRPHEPVLVPVQDVWRDGCAALGRNACELLRAAGKPVAPGTVCELIRGLPAEPTDLMNEDWKGRSLLYACLRTVYEKRGADPARYQALKDYFLIYLLDLPRAVRRMLKDSFVGVLGSVTLDERFTEEIDDATITLGGGTS